MKSRNSFEIGFFSFRKTSFSDWSGAERIDGINPLQLTFAVHDNVGGFATNRLEYQMDPRLRKLIDSYIDAVAECVDQLVISGARLPSKDYEWPPGNFEPSGTLPDGRTYRCHGVGCEIKSTKGLIVDFDFGENGETDGFSISRLLIFVGDKPIQYGFASRDEVSVAFNNAISEFHFSGYILYYLSEAPRNPG